MIARNEQLKETSTEYGEQKNNSWTTKLKGNEQEGELSNRYRICQLLQFIHAKNREKQKGEEE